MSRIQL